MNRRRQHRSASPGDRSYIGGNARGTGGTPDSARGSGGGTGDGDQLVYRVVREGGGGGSYPMLTKSNYYTWAALMRVKMQARGLWTAVDVGTENFIDDRNALEAITMGLPPELQGSIASKTSAKIAWDSLKKTHLGADRVRQARANTLRREFDSLKFKDGESVDDFGVRITDLANQLKVLDSGYTEPEIVRKFLQATPPRFGQIVMAIETLLDLDQMTVEDLIGRLKAADERHRLGGNGGGSSASLNLTEDELVARVLTRLQLSGDGSPGGGKTSATNRRSRGTGHDKDGGSSSGSKPYAGGNGKKKKVANNECRYCGKAGH
ncbi:hypothetical protein GUJ93_ZPchr0006g43514 [Zizania palustris]|uniref:DUF4219 domain-containing protein n=1 Tax=Zizania palustris TaxID=103762 RepID=A0A8J5VKP7_ZIZPA|nr:hypothetical protein GUJ93_ZPchr0006g43514 [Zizania palustris]